MLNSTRQQLEGQAREEEGAARQKAGEVTHDPELESEGRSEKIAGIVQKKLGQLEALIDK